LAPYLETRPTEVDPDPGSFLTEVKTSFVADAGSG
jgi:hypothetical protein